MSVPFDAFRAQPFPMAVELGNMFQFYAETPQFDADRDVDAVRELNPRLQSLQQFLAGHKDERSPRRLTANRARWAATRRSHRSRRVGPRRRAAATPRR